MRNATAEHRLDLIETELKMYAKITELYNLRFREEAQLKVERAQILAKVVHQGGEELGWSRRPLGPEPPAPAA